MPAPVRRLSSSSRALQHLDREPTADEADTSMENLAWKLFDFLKCMSQDIWKFSTSYATEQAASRVLAEKRCYRAGYITYLMCRVVHARVQQQSIATEYCYRAVPKYTHLSIRT